MSASGSIQAATPEAATVADRGLYVYEPTDVDHAGDPVAEARPALVRSAVYTFRALLGLVLALIGMASLLVFERALIGLRDDLLTLRASWPEPLVSGIEATLSLVLLAAIVGTNGFLLWRRKYRRLIMINLAAVAAGSLAITAGQTVLGFATSDALADVIESGEGGFVNDALASLVAVLTVSTVWIGRRLRPWVIGLTAAVASLSFFGDAVSVMTLPVDVGIGMLTGALVALVLKTRDRTPTASELAMTLEQTGVRVARVERAAVDARGSVPWFVSTTDGDELFVKTLNSDQRAADLLFRIYRMIRLRRPGDRKPFSSLRRAVEHEAFLSLAADSRDIRTPRLVAATEIGNDGMLLAYRKLEGRSLDSVDPGEITDAMLVGVWRLVALLRSAAIAHRDLRLANVFIADDGVPWLIDFGFAELAADETLLARDTAELLASTATVVGPEQSVAVAIEVLGKDTVAAATPWIQPLALSSATRSQVGDRDQFSRLHAAAASALGLEEVEHEKMERVSRTTMLLVASVGFSLYVLIPQLATETGYFDELAGIHFGWAGLALAASALTYVGATWTVMGSVPVRLEVGPVLSTQLATSFSRRVTLTSLEASSTNVRLLQKHNLPRSVTETAVRLTAVAETAVFDSLLAASLLGAGWLAEAALTTAVIVGTIVVGSAALTVLPTGRALLVRRLKRFRLASAATTALTKSPSRLLALYGGTAVVIISYTACMLASLRAFGVDLPVATGAAVYLMASATAALIPTPGSIGVSEAALFLGYRIVGVAVPAAFAAVLLFRFVTFWLPLVPGWLALRALRRSGRL